MESNDTPLESAAVVTLDAVQELTSVICHEAQLCGTNSHDLINLAHEQAKLAVVNGPMTTCPSLVYADSLEAMDVMRNALEELEEAISQLKYVKLVAEETFNQLEITKGKNMQIQIVMLW